MLLLDVLIWISQQGYKDDSIFVLDLADILIDIDYLLNTPNSGGITVKNIEFFNDSVVITINEYD